MYQNVSLNEKDYGNIYQWNQLAFAKNNNQTKSDKNTFKKTRIYSELSWDHDLESIRRFFSEKKFRFNEKDYGNILRWFELAFAKSNKQSQSDRTTFTKLSAMALAYADEIRERL